MTILIALMALAVQEPEPGDFAITVSGEEQIIKKVTYTSGADWLRIEKTGKPGLALFLTKTAGGTWTAERRRTPELWLSDSLGGRLNRLTVRIDSTDDGRLQGTWSGSLQDARGRQTPLSGSFNLAPAGAFDKPKNTPVNAAGCVFVWILLLANAGVGLWFVATAFQQSLGWGFAVLLLPFANVLFVAMHWDVAKKPFLWSLGLSIGTLLAVLLMI